eukprot:3773148-Rhodomonas_salina.1
MEHAMLLDEALAPAHGPNQLASRLIHATESIVNCAPENTVAGLPVAVCTAIVSMSAPPESDPLSPMYR